MSSASQVSSAAGGSSAPRSPPSSSNIPTEFLPEHIAQNTRGGELYSDFIKSQEPTASTMKPGFHMSARLGLGVRHSDAQKLQGRTEFPGLDPNDDTLYYNTRGAPEAYWAKFDLPKPTKDIHRLRRDMLEWGYCLIQDGLSPAQLKAARERLYDQAEGEKKAGVACYSLAAPTPGNPLPRMQIINNLINKGDQFVGFLEHDPNAVQAGPLIEQLIGETIGPDFLTSSFIGMIALKGNIPQNLHQDHAMGPYQFSAAPLTCNTIVLIDDFTNMNGGTLIIPGSHKFTSYPLKDPLPPAISLQAPAGTIMVFEGRVLHGTGVNWTDKPRAMLTTNSLKPFLRQQEVHILSTLPEVLKRASPKLLYRLGLRSSTIGVGGVEGNWFAHWNLGPRFALEEGKFIPIARLGKDSTKEDLETDYSYRHSELGFAQGHLQRDATQGVKEKYEDGKLEPLYPLPKMRLKL